LAIQKAYQEKSYAQAVAEQLTADEQVLNEALILNINLHEQMKKPSVDELLAYKDKMHISGE